MGNIKRAVTKVDCQPMADGGVLVFVLGQLQAVGCIEFELEISTVILEQCLATQEISKSECCAMQTLTYLSLPQCSDRN